MRKARFTDDNIANILAQKKAGVPAIRLCCEHGISLTTIYNWQKRTRAEINVDIREMISEAAKKVTPAEVAECHDH